MFGTVSVGGEAYALMSGYHNLRNTNVIAVKTTKVKHVHRRDLEEKVKAKEYEQKLLRQVDLFQCGR